MRKQDSVQSAVGLERDFEKSGRLADRSSRAIPVQVGRLFYAIGFFASSYPFAVIVFSIIIVLLSSYPISTVPLPGSRPKEFTTAYENYSSPSLTPTEENLKSWPRWYREPQALFVQQILVKSSVYPWNSDLIISDAFRGTLSKSFQLVNMVKNVTTKAYDGSPGLSEMCFQVLDVKSKALKGKNSMLPEYNCLLLSPTNFWHDSYSAFQNDPDILGTILNYQSHQKGRSGLAEMLLGVSIKDTGLKRNPFKARQRLVSYAVTIILQKYDPVFIENLELKLKTFYGAKSILFLEKYGIQKSENYTAKPHDFKENRIVHIFYPSHSSLIQLIPLIFTYIAMFLYVYFSVKKIEMVKSKLGIAFSALSGVVGSLCMSLGLCTHFGMAYDCNAKAIFPYIVVIIGLENVLVLTRSVVSTAPHLDAKIRIAQGLSKEGWSIIKNLSAEITILTVGFFTFIPKIQEFCILAIVGLLSDFFIQIFFFATILSVDIRRNELANGAHHPASAFTPFRKPIHPRLGRVKSNTGLTNGSVHSNKNGASVQVVAPSQLSPIFVKIPKRLKVVSFWARTRFFQRTFIIFMVGWISFIIYESGIIVHFNIEADDVVIPSTQFDDSTSAKQRVSLSLAQNTGGSYLVNRTMLKKNKINHSETLVNNSTDKLKEVTHYHNAKLLNDLNECNPYTLRRLSLYHWQVLLGIYNVSLNGKYISILPPICLSIPVDPSEAISKRNIHEQDQATKFNWHALSSNTFEPVDFVDEYDMNVPVVSQVGKVGEEGFFDSFSSWDDPYVPSSPIELALTVLLAIPSVIFISYSLIVFYRCVCSRNYAEWRSSWNYGQDAQDYYTQVVFEAVPLVLDGHTQEVECMGSDGNVISSVCLDGVLKIWNINTGDNIVTIDRKRYFEELSLHSDNDISNFFVGSDADSPIESSPPTTVNSTTYFRTPDSENSRLVQNSETRRRQHTYSLSESPPTSTTQKNDPLFTSHQAQYFPGPESMSFSNSIQSNSQSTDEFYISSENQRIANHQQNDHLNYDHSVPIPIRKEYESVVEPPIRTMHFSRGNSESALQFGSDSVALNKSLIRPNSRVESPEKILESNCLGGAPPVWCLDSFENIVILGTGSGRIEFWDACAGYLKCTYDDESGVGIMCIKLVGNKIVAAKINGSLDFLQIESHSRVSESPSLYHRFPGQMTNGSDNRFTPSGYESEIRCVWLSTQKAHQQPITCLDCDNINIVTGSQDHSLKVFRLEDQQPHLSLHGHYGPITCVFIDKVSPLTSGSGSLDGLLCVWDLQTGMCVYSIQAHDGPISALTYSVSYIISAGGDDKICVWERFQGHLLNTIQLDHAYCSNLVMLTHNLLITSKQGSLIVWDVRSGDAVRAVRLGHRDNTVFVRQIMICSDAILCDYGSQLRLVRFPSVISKVD